MKFNNLYLVLKYDCVHNKYFEILITENKNNAYECFNLLSKVYSNEMFIITKVLEV